jgi:hypothetical protein
VGTFLRSPEVPGFWSENGWVETVRMLIKQPFLGNC